MPIFPEKNIGMVSNITSDKHNNAHFSSSSKQNPQSTNPQKQQEKNSFSANVNRDSTSPESRNASPIINLCNSTPSTYDQILKQKQHMINTYTKTNSGKKKPKNSNKNEYFTNRESTSNNA